MQKPSLYTKLHSSTAATRRRALALGSQCSRRHRVQSQSTIKHSQAPAKYQKVLMPAIAQYVVATPDTTAVCHSERRCCFTHFPSHFDSNARILTGLLEPGVIGRAIDSPPCFFFTSVNPNLTRGQIIPIINFPPFGFSDLPTHGFVVLTSVKFLSACFFDMIVDLYVLFILFFEPFSARSCHCDLIG